MKCKTSCIATIGFIVVGMLHFCTSILTVYHATRQCCWCRMSQKRTRVTPGWSTSYHCNRLVSWDVAAWSSRCRACWRLRKCWVGRRRSLGCRAAPHGGTSSPRTAGSQTQVPRQPTRALSPLAKSCMPEINGSVVINSFFDILLLAELNWNLCMYIKWILCIICTYVSCKIWHACSHLPAQNLKK
jgi:hypothetical protein